MNDAEKYGSLIAYRDVTASIYLIVPFSNAIGIMKIRL